MSFRRSYDPDPPLPEEPGLDDPDVPMLIGEPDPDLPGHCRVSCPWCRRYHHHGMDPDSDFEGFRHAHCAPGSPFKETGYHVVNRKTAARMRPTRWRQEP